MVFECLKGLSLTFVGGDSDHYTLFYFNIKEFVYSFGGGDALTQNQGLLNPQRQPLRGLAQEGECTSVGAGSPWPVAMIGAASGEKEKLLGRRS
jgi:hypothetical protein